MPEATAPEIPDHIRAYVGDVFNDGEPPKNLHVESGGYGFTKANRQPCLVTPERIISDLGVEALPVAPKAAVDGQSLRDKYLPKAAAPTEAKAPAKADEPKAPAAKP